MRVHHLCAGTSRPPLAALARMPGARRHALPCHVLLVETDGGVVLVDTGVRGAALHQVRGRGFHARDVRHVIVTSLAHDHAAGLSDFPDAEVHVLATEHAAATRGGPLARLRYRPEHWAHRPRWRLHVPRGERWLGIACVRDALPDGIAIVPLPGPTRGHAGVAVRSDHGWLLHAGDAYLRHDEVHAIAPPADIALAVARAVTDSDPAARASTLERLRVLARDPDGTVLVFSSHDELELEACAERNPAGVPPAPAPARRGTVRHLRLVGGREAKRVAR